jgi:hypothetical protein
MNINRRVLLSLLSGVGATSYFFAPFGGWTRFLPDPPKPWWHPDVLPGVLAELGAHYHEIRGFGVPLNPQQWKDARSKKEHYDGLYVTDNEEWKKLAQKRREEDRIHMDPLARVVFYDLAQPLKRSPGQYHCVTAEDMCALIDDRSGKI